MKNPHIPYPVFIEGISLENKMKCGIVKCGRYNIGSQYVFLDGLVCTYVQLERLPTEY